MVKYGGPRPVKAIISTPVRLLDTIYQNLTGRPLVVVVCVTCIRITGLGRYALINAQVEAATPPTAVQATAGLPSQDNTPEALCPEITFFVTPGFYYRVATAVEGAGSIVTLSQWTEVEL